MKKFIYASVIILSFAAYAAYQGGLSQDLSVSIVHSAAPVVVATAPQPTPVLAPTPTPIPAPVQAPQPAPAPTPIPVPVVPTPISAPVPKVVKTPVVAAPPKPVVPAKAPPPPPAPIVPPKPKGMYTDGQYTGSQADAYYGIVQVRVTISGGKISNVAFLQYPNDRNHSISINNYAMPYLISEAISAQNANVDIVSGATDTSQAFQQSLGAALSQAKS